MRQSIIALGLLAVPHLAHADVTRCSHADADLSYLASDLGDHTGDTGWFPSDTAAQLRITGQLVGQTSVAMGLSPTACWDKGMTLTAPARMQTGNLDAEYGADVHVYGQIHTSVLGHQIDWDGELPVPFTDFLLADQTGFDGAMLPGSAGASASDTTSRILPRRRRRHRSGDRLRPQRRQPLGDRPADRSLRRRRHLSRRGRVRLAPWTNGSA